MCKSSQIYVPLRPEINAPFSFAIIARDKKNTEWHDGMKPSGIDYTSED